MLSRLSIRTRLLALLLVPMMTLVVGAGLQLSQAIGAVAEARNVDALTRVSSVGRDLASSLQLERSRSIETISGFSDDASPEPTPEALTAARADVDAARDVFSQTVTTLDLSESTTALLAGAEEQVQNTLAPLDDFREALDRGEATVGLANDVLDQPINALLSINGQIVDQVQDPVVAERLRTAQAVSQYKDAVFRSVDLVAPTQNEVLGVDEARANLAEIQAEQRTWLAAAMVTLDAEERATMTARVADVATTGVIVASFSAAPQTSQSMTDLGGTENAVRQVEDQFYAEAAAAAGSAGDDAVLRIAVIAILTVVVLALVALLLLTLLRKVVAPLRELSGLADSSKTSLPAIVERLAAGEEPEASVFAGDEAKELLERPDELGELARAIAATTDEASRVAAQQAVIRRSISRTIEDVARREQTLVERQLSLLDALEDAERDPDQLAQLFKLDHLATRMRRNAENLLLLASGQLPGVQSSAPVSLVDVVRTAASEIEQYGRVDVRIGVSATVAGFAATPLSHLLAELIENAAQFSPPQSRVLVTGYADSNGITVAVSDEGLGMTQGDLADARRRLASPPLLEVAESRRLGLYVVGLIANRLGLVVDLDLSDSGKGLTATVAIPAAAFVDGVSTDQRPVEPVRAEPQLPSSLDSSGDALDALSQLLDASPSAPPDLPAGVVPVVDQALPTRSTEPQPVEPEPSRGLSFSAASKGRKVDFDPSSIRDLMSGLNGIGDSYGEDDRADEQLPGSLGNSQPQPVRQAQPDSQVRPVQPAPQAQPAAHQPAAHQPAAAQPAPYATQPAPQAHPAPHTPQPASPQPAFQPQAAPQALQHAHALPVSEPGPPPPAWDGELHDQAAPAALPVRGEAESALPTRPLPPSSGFASQAAGFSAQIYDAAAEAPQGGEPDNDTTAPRPPRRRRSTAPSWSTPYAPQEQKL